MSRGFQRAFGGDSSERQGVGGIVSSNAWIMPVAGVAGVAYFREPLQNLIEYIVGRILTE